MFPKLSPFSYSLSPLVSCLLYGCLGCFLQSAVPFGPYLPFLNFIFDNFLVITKDEFCFEIFCSSISFLVCCFVVFNISQLFSYVKHYFQKILFLFLFFLLIYLYFVLFSENSKCCFLNTFLYKHIHEFMVLLFVSQETIQRNILFFYFYASCSFPTDIETTQKAYLLLSI